MSVFRTDASGFMACDRFVIEHPAIYKMMTYGDQEGPGSLRLPIVNWNTWGLPPRGILTWLGAQALGVYRYPWHPDQCQVMTPLGKDKAGALTVLRDHFGTPEQVQLGVKQMQLIYAHTQAVFRRRNQKTIVLHRSFRDDLHTVEGYADRLISQRCAALHLGLDSFQLNTNLLTSWSESDGYGGYPVTISVEHPVENVFWGSDLIASKSWHPEKAAVEAGEWVIIDRSFDGRLTVPVSGVSPGQLPVNWRPQYERGSHRTLSANGRAAAAQAYLSAQADRLEPLQHPFPPYYPSRRLMLSFNQRLKLACWIIRGKG